MAPSFTARLQILAAALLFSTGGMAIKSCQLSNWQVAGLRSALAVPVLLLCVRQARRRPNLGTLAVGLAYALTLVLYVQANKTTTAANTIFLQSTAPLYLVFIAPLLLGEKARRRDLVYMAVLVVGLLLILGGGETASATAPAPALGNFLAVTAGFTWAWTVLGLRWLARRDSGAGASAVVVGNLLALLGCLPFALPFGPARPVDLLWILYLGVFQIGFAYVFLTSAMGRVSALEASLLLLVEPVFNPIWAWWVLGEVPVPAALLGALVILVATAVKTWIDFRRSPAAEGAAGEVS